MRAVIFGCEGLGLSDWERGFFQEVDPWGYIVFLRNIDNPGQLKRLTDDMRDIAGRDDAPILIDQEGGRVARLKPPHWGKYPTGDIYAQLAKNDIGAACEAAGLVVQVMAAELKSVGINVDCLPILDVRQDFSHDVIGDRAYGYDADTVTAIGRAVADALLSQGVLPVIKHIPGHGRAKVDSHDELPIAEGSKADLAAVDFAPFRALSALPMAMTAHLVYPALDPDHPATTSAHVISSVIRETIGFSGLLMTDDLSMKALGGSFEDRTRESLQAGCDLILHCNGRRDEMEAVASATPELAGLSLKRADDALAWFGRVGEPVDIKAAKTRLGELGVEVEFA